MRSMHRSDDVEEEEGVQDTTVEAVGRQRHKHGAAVQEEEVDRPTSQQATRGRSQTVYRPHQRSTATLSMDQDLVA